MSNSPHSAPVCRQMRTIVRSSVAGALKSSRCCSVKLSWRGIFIAQGANDPRVNKNESDQMVEALRKRGVEVQYMVKDNEGHGFHNEENQFDFYGAMEAFFRKYLGK